MSNENRRKASSIGDRKLYVQIGIRIIFILVLFIMIWSFAVTVMNMVVEETNETYNVSEQIRRCDDYYYNGKYGQLYDMLNLFDYRGEEFDLYWEIVDGFLDYQDYLCWSRLEEADMRLVDLKGGLERSIEVRKYAQKVKQNAEECRFDRNQKTLDRWAAWVP